MISMHRTSPLRRSFSRVVLAGALAATGLAQCGTLARAGGDPVLLAAGDVGTCNAAGLQAGRGGAGAPPPPPPATAEGRCLSADWAAPPAACTLASCHDPRFYSFTSAGPLPPTGNTSYDADPTMDAMWQILQAHRADVVLNGHRHVYERFPKMVLPAPTGGGPGVPDPVNGIREFVVGTGGGPHHHFDPDPRDDPTQTIYEPNSEVHIQQAFGVLRLSLHAGSYGWQFLD